MNGETKPTVAIVGVGLIGGSLGMSWKMSGVINEVIGISRRSETIDRAVRAGAIDRGTLDLSEGVSDADVVIIASPVNSIVPLYKEMRASLKPGAVVSDVGSTKSVICESIWATGAGEHTFIGGHPMAGSERAGVSAADPYLFENAVYVITPPKRCKQSHVRLLTRLIEVTGARPIVMTPKQHDETVAAVSHLPHVVAASLVTFASEREKDLPGLLTLAAGGFRDTTRIASGHEDVWTDICLSNIGPIMNSVDELELILKRFKQALLAKDANRISEMLAHARSVREKIPAKAKGIMSAVYDVVVHVVDRPGSIRDVATLLGDRDINIIDIEILRVREGEGGTLRLGFECIEEMEHALSALADGGYRARYRE